VVRLRVSAVLLLSLLCACGRSAQTDPKSVPLKPEQLACIDVVQNKQLAMKGEFARQHLDALAAQRSTVQLTLVERRMNEEVCLEYAKCFGADELGLGVMFESCLKEAEREL